MRDSERRQALAAFIDEGERAQPPVFTGREKVIEDIAGAAELVYRKWLSGSVDAMDPGLTRLVQGAPGAGKTALLRRLQERWRGGPAPGCPIAVRVSASALASPEGMRAQLLEQVPKTIMDKWGPVVMGGLARLIPGGEAVGPAAEAATEEALRERREKRLPAAIVVMVDETTRVEPHSAAATTLQNLHDGSFGVVPVLPVFAGLGYLHSHLQQKGIEISRYSDDSRCVHTLEGFDETECRTLLQGWLDFFAVTGSSSGLDQWSEALYRDTQGWPMHTNGFLTALATELTKPDDKTIGRLASADLEKVRMQAAKSRAVYYDGRYEGIIQREVRWVGRAMADLDVASGEFFEEDATAVIWKAGSSDAGEGPSRGEAQAIFGGLVERGFLQRRGTGLTFSSPVPSLTSHAAIAATANRKVNGAAAIGDVAEVSHQLSDGGEIEGRDALGRTPLRIAAECRWADLTQDLVDAGADMNAPDAKGVTPRDAWPNFDWPDPYPGRVRERKQN